MTSGIIALFLILCAGLLGGNDLIVIAAGLLIALRLAALPDIFGFLQAHVTQLGIIFLFIGLLLPLATEQVGLKVATKSLFGIKGFATILIGAWAAHLAAQGVNLLTTYPEMMMAMIIGSLVGVTLFGGIPAGPLVAAGLASLLYRLIDFL